MHEEDGVSGDSRIFVTTDETDRSGCPVGRKKTTHRTHEKQKMRGTTNEEIFRIRVHDFVMKNGFHCLV